MLMNAHKVNREKRPRALAARQDGVMLLEALIAILIFSLGILSLVALQATAIQLTSDARYRTDASLLANRLLGEMWASGLDLAQLKANFESGGAGYDTWKNIVASRDGLPGVGAAADGVDSTLPLVSVDATAGATAGQVVITLFWRTPEMPRSGEPANQPTSCRVSRHCHTIVSQISRNTP